MCDWIEEGGMDRNLEEMRGFALREEWMVSSIIMSEVIGLVE